MWAQAAKAPKDPEKTFDAKETRRKKIVFNKNYEIAVPIRIFTSFKILIFEKAKTTQKIENEKLL